MYTGVRFKYSQYFFIYMSDNKIGFWTLISIVISAQLGASIFVMPAEMAKFRTAGLLGWVLACVGAILLTMVFSYLCKSDTTGGPHVYAKKFFGRDFGFFITWIYWCAAWACNPVMVSASIEYLMTITGPMSQTTKLMCEILLVVILTIINVIGIKASGYLEVILTILKIGTLIIVPFLAAGKVNLDNFNEITRSDIGIMPAITGATITAFWGFVGLEGGTSPADKVKNPKRTIPIAIVSGTAFVALISLINTVSIFGIISPAELEKINAPFAFIMSAIFGSGYEKITGFITFLMCAGSLNAWVLLSGQIAKTASLDKMLPMCFSRENKYGAPVIGILVSSIGTICILLLQQTEFLANKIGEFMDMSVIVYIILYITTVVACLKFLLTKKSITYTIIALAALLFCLCILFFSPISRFSFIILVSGLGIPCYLYMKKQWSKTPC